MTHAIEELRRHLGEISDLRNASSVLGWDQQTCMPPRGGAQRAAVMETLEGLAHARFTGEETLRLLDAAEGAVAGRPEEDDDRCLVRITRRDYERARKLPAEFVAAWTRDGILSNEAWRTARPANDFAAFRPFLEAQVDYARRAADYYGYAEHPYDALLEGFEPGLTTAEVRRVFEVMRPAQVELVRRIAERPAPQADFLTREVPETAQEAFGMRVAADFGYDTQRGRVDVAPHPFETSFGRDDVRITTRYDRRFFPQALFAIFHETGHALYEQNVAPELARTPLSSGCSNVFHESQSRLWENLVARSPAFWRHYFPLLKETLGGVLDDVDCGALVRAINRVEPSLIRVEADEVTYNLHIILRFELELALVSGQLAVADLPAAWNERMEEYLGVRPPDDRDGAMQDTHWSTGSLGYFPTYALGNVMGAQIFASLGRDLPDVEGLIEAGDFPPLLAWLSDRVYRHGRKYLPAELALKVNGAPLDPQPYLEYLRGKFGDLYGV